MKTLTAFIKGCVRTKVSLNYAKTKYALFQTSPFLNLHRCTCLYKYMRKNRKSPENYFRSNPQ